MWNNKKNKDNGWHMFIGVCKPPCLTNNIEPSRKITIPTRSLRLDACGNEMIIVLLIVVLILVLILLPFTAPTMF